MSMIEVICNDRLGKKVRVKCNSDDTIGDLKKLIAAQTGTWPSHVWGTGANNVFAATKALTRPPPSQASAFVNLSFSPFAFQPPNNLPNTVLAAPPFAHLPRL